MSNEKKKISQRLTQKEIDNRAEVLNRKNAKYYKSRIPGLTDEQANKIIELNSLDD